MRRRSLMVSSGAVAAGVFAPSILRAQGAKDFPNKPITLIMPWPAGSGVEPTPLMRERLWFTPTVASGSCWPRAPRRLARASSMRATASARSRLCARASASKPPSTGSLKLRHQSSAILGTPAVPAGSSSAGRW